MAANIYQPKFSYDLLTKGSKKRSGIKLAATGKDIAWGDHDTGNPYSTAAGNISFYRRVQYTESASAHFFTDDKGTRICIPCFPKIAEKAWHMRYQCETDNAMWGDDANDIAIGGELCYFPNDKARSLKAYQNYIEFAAYLAYLHGGDPRRRAGHYEIDPSRRTDPKNALSYLGKTYNDMKNDIVDFYEKHYSVRALDPHLPAQYAVESQKWVKEQGISDGNYPYNLVTREQLWVMLYRIFIGKENSFDEARIWTVDSKISDGQRGKDNIKRIELWTMLGRAFDDLKPSPDWRAEANIWAVKNKISDGLNPDDRAERQMLWVMLNRCINTFGS